MAESSTLGLLFEINADPQKAQKALEAFLETHGNVFAAITRQFADYVESVTGLSTTAILSIVAIGVAAYEAAKELEEMTAKAIEDAAELSKVSQRVGTAVEDLSALKYAADELGRL